MRLIDADKLMEYCLNQKSRTIDCNDIARFPTAYSVDKVVEELETKKEFCKGEWETFNSDYYRGRYNSLVDAIETIMEG